MKIIYLPMVGDLFHIGHLRAIRQCAKYGEVIIGLVDCPDYKKTIIPYKQRREIIAALPEVHSIVKQNSLNPSKHLKRLKPDYVASGDGWEPEELQAIKENNCKALDISYCKEQSSTKIKKKIYEEITKTKTT